MKSTGAVHYLMYNRLVLRSPTRVSFDTSFDSKQPKLEPKLVSALSETKRLFQLFCFYIETEIFDVLIEPKQTEDQPKQFDRKHILLVFCRKFWVFPFFCGYFRFFSVCFKTVCFGCFASVQKQRVSMFRLNRNIQKITQTVWKRVYLGIFRKFWVASVC